MLSYFLCFVCGGLLVLGFAPFYWAPIALIAPGVLAYYHAPSNLSSSFWRGLSFGLGLMSFGVYWIFICVHQYGHANLFISFIATALFVCVNALMYALFSLAFNGLSRFTWLTLAYWLLFPCCWVFFEWLRAHILSGFPWLLLGYTQVTGPFKIIIPFVGVYGTSFVVALIASSLSLLIQPVCRSIKITSAAIVLALVGGFSAISTTHWTQPTNAQVNVALLQGNIDQSIKWNPQFAQSTLNNYLDLIRQNKDADLIVLPEGAFPVWNTSIAPLLTKLQQTAKAQGNSIIIGLPYFSKNGQAYNSLLMLGQFQGLYFKRKLVPFGEYIPYGNLFEPLLRSIDLGNFGYAHGPQHQPLLPFGSTRIAPFICYEVAYSNEVIEQAKHSGFLVVISDDSWYGKSIALNQQLEIAQMRALETGRPVLTSNSTGITAVIDPMGRIQHSIPIDQRGVLRANIRPVTGQTPLVRWGYPPVFYFLLALFIICFAAPRYTTKKNHSKPGSS